MGGGPTSSSISTTDRLANLRKLMQDGQNNVQAYVIPSEDQHSSEYIAECDQRRVWISGFSGSAGTAIVTLNGAFMFTDGRYFLQARQQMDQNWELMKQGVPDVPTWQEYLTKHLPPSSRIGIDPSLIAAVDAKSLTTQLVPRSSSLVSLTENLVDQIWTDQPPRPENEVFKLGLEYAGQSPKEKIAAVREKLNKISKDGKLGELEGIVVNMLDEVAWLLNLRGSDIAFNPVFFGYVLITADKATLFINPAQISVDVKQYLQGEGVTVEDYDKVFGALSVYARPVAAVSADPTAEKSLPKILVSNKASLALHTALGGDLRVAIDRSPVADLKAIKNPVEVEGFRQSHIRDGAALARYFAWLEEQLDKGVVLNEAQGADKLEEFRSQLERFKGLSFDTISGTGPNGAIIHYKLDPHDSAVIKRDQIYLCDSGGQFLDGTTDVTRTWHFGTPTAEEKRAFTRVLQGHIAIDQAVFPKGVTGYQLDALARTALWKDGLDYRHGTGHGVGHFLNVHEGPQGIGTRLVLNETALEVGMTVSNEPGYYADGRFGIRIESIVIVKEAKTPNHFGEKPYYGFENVTMCPIHRKLIDTPLLSPEEHKWVDKYHEEVLQKVSPLLQGSGEDDKRALAWLKKETAAL